MIILFIFTVYFSSCRSRDTVIGIVTRLQTGCSRFESWQGQQIFLLSKMSTTALEPTHLYLVQRLEVSGDTSGPCIWLHGMDSDNCTFYILVSRNIRCRNVVLYIGYTILLKLGELYVGAYCLVSSCKTLFFLFLSGQLVCIVRWMSIKDNMIIFLHRMQMENTNKLVQNGTIKSQLSSFWQIARNSITYPAFLCVLSIHNQETVEYLLPLFLSCDEFCVVFT